MLYIRVAV